MIINIKIKDIINKGKWEKFCDMFGIQLYAVNEGLLNGEEEFAMTKEQAIELGLIKGDK